MSCHAGQIFPRNSPKFLEFHRTKFVSLCRQGQRVAYEKRSSRHLPVDTESPFSAGLPTHARLPCQHSERCDRGQGKGKNSIISCPPLANTTGPDKTRNVAPSSEVLTEIQDLRLVEIETFLRRLNQPEVDD